MPKIGISPNSGTLLIVFDNVSFIKPAITIVAPSLTIIVVSASVVEIIGIVLIAAGSWIIIQFIELSQQHNHNVSLQNPQS